MDVQIWTTTTLSSQGFLEILDWQQYEGFSLGLLVEREESWVYRQEVEMLLAEGVKIIVYDALEDGTAQLVKKKTPSLRDIWGAFQSRDVEGSIFCFVNADIRPVFTRAGRELAIIRYAFDSKKVLAANRQDYEDSLQSSQVYSEGFDFFGVPGELLEKYADLPLERYRIGQVGWDYALPLMINRCELVKVPSMGLYHKLHPTGSEEDWGKSICRLALDVDSSWIESISLVNKIVFFIVRYIQKKRLVTGEATKQRFELYAISRLMYYGAIQAMLKSMHTLAD